jgi:hypothetical protein
MAFDVFISYSSKDKPAADATCATLESAGIRCWIAPRDVRPGTDYAGAIIDAIDTCRVMVLIFSSNSNASRQIRREIERAAHKEVPIVPLRIEEITPTKSLEYFLGEIHWLDALTPPLAAHLNKLIETVRAILQVDPETTTAQGSGAAARPKPDVATSRRSPFWRIRPSAIQVGLIALAGMLSAAVLLLLEQRYSSGPERATSPARPAPTSEASIRRGPAFGANGGSAFDDADENPERRQISSLTIVVNLNPGDQSQRIIGSLQTRWGDKSGPLHGGKGPYAQPAQVVQLRSDERIGRVDVNWMSYHYPTPNPPQWVAGLAIWTDVSVYNFGDMSFGPTDQCVLAHGETLIGFFGRSGSYIDQIGCIIGKSK